MNREVTIHKVEGAETLERPRVKQAERLQQTIQSRDAKQAELLKLLRQPGQLGEPAMDAWDAWMELQIIQNDLDLLVKNELRKRLVK